MSQEANSSIQTQLGELLAVGPVSERAARALLSENGAGSVELEAALAGVDWNIQAEKAYREETKLQHEELLPIAVRTSLLARGFTRGQTETVLAGIDWTSFFDSYLKLRAEIGLAPGRAMTYELKKAGFTDAQIQAAYDRAHIDVAGTLRTALSIGLERNLSRRALQDFLTGLDYPKQQVRQAIREAQIDWTKQAILAAEDIAGAAVHEEVAERALETLGFSRSEISTALDTVAFGSLAAACRTVRLYLDLEGVSADYLSRTLASVGYKPDIAAAAMLEMDVEQLDWTETGARAIALRLTSDAPALTGSRDAVVDALRSFGYSHEQIERGIELADPDWVERAVREFRSRNEQGPATMDSPRSAIRTLEEMGFLPREAREAARELFNNQDESQAALTEVRSCIWACGRRALEEGLREADYTEDIVADTLDHVYFDWNERAVDAAGQISEEVEEQIGAISPLWLRQILDGRGFEPDQIDYAMEHYPADWDDMAARYALMVPADSGSPDLRAILEEAQFPAPAVDAAVAAAGSGN